MKSFFNTMQNLFFSLPIILFLLLLLYVIIFGNFEILKAFWKGLVT